MRKLEFFKTEEGQKCLYQKRRLSRLHFQIDQEPKSKKSIRLDEKIEFQKKVLAALHERSRAAFRSPIILEITFFSNQKNPPTVSALTKNYLDLLSTPIPGSGINVKHILYTDDALVKVLIANQRLGSQSVKSQIFIRAGKLTHFVNDVELAYGSRASFEDDSVDTWHDHIRELKKLIHNKARLLAEPDGAKTFTLWKEQLISLAQKSFVESQQIDNYVLSCLLQPYFKFDYDATEFKDIFFQLNSKIRDSVISSRITKGLFGPPTQNGGTKLFKKSIEKSINEFVSRYPFIIPLKILIGLTILYIPPKGQVIDLDNLAKLIIPSISKLINPPTHWAELVDVSNFDNKGFKEIVVNAIQEKPHMPSGAITSYQVIEVPRQESDPPDGIVNILFSDGNSPLGLWHETDDIIKKLEEENY